MTKVLEVSIAPEIFDQIRDAVQNCSKSGIPLDGAPIDILITLPGNRVVLVSPEDEELIPIEEIPNIKPLSLIPAAFFVGEGSHYSGCAVGNTSKWRRNKH